MERSDRKARASAPQEVYKNSRLPSLVFCVFFLRRYRVSHFSILDARLFLALCVFGKQAYSTISFSNELSTIPFFKQRQDRFCKNLVRDQLPIRKKRLRHGIPQMHQRGFLNSPCPAFRQMKMFCCLRQGMVLRIQEPVPIQNVALFPFRKLIHCEI